jgi:hypothetical protein
MLFEAEWSPMLEPGTRLAPTKSCRSPARAGWARFIAPATARLDRDVAVKVLRKEVATDSDCVHATGALRPLTPGPAGAALVSPGARTPWLELSPDPSGFSAILPTALTPDGSSYV